MDRATIFLAGPNDEGTFQYDEELPPLPLPKLEDTLERYYESLKPFGTPEELAQSRACIEAFKNGIGKELHSKLMERASKCRNWLEGWWEDYAYHLLRFPLNPYTVMAMPAKMEYFNVSDTPEMLQKNLSRLIYHTIEFWELMRREKLKPLSSNNIKYSSALYKRFYSTTRVPGIEQDHLECYFKTLKEGPMPTHGVVSGKGRLFIFDCVHKDGSTLTPQELLVLVQRMYGIIDHEPLGSCVPILTHDDRTSWARNRQYLVEVSPKNKEVLKLVESACIVLALDEHEPKDYEEISQVAIYGDYHTKWGDRASTIVAFKNGKFAFIGEHSAYDGTISVSYANFILMSLFEVPEPDWSQAEHTQVVPLTELHFTLDDTLQKEIQRVTTECDQRRNDITVTHMIFDDFGKDFMKSCNLHPDSFIQVVMQLTYTKMHNEIAPTYETALTRHFYNGRTETLRSCTNEVYNFLKIATNPSAKKIEVLKAFKKAVEHHNHMMNEARKGHGVDRHLFGLWCVAYENKMDIPDFYSDTLYLKSGGGGNFVLSTSTLGYSVCVGFVGPMVLDGYGVFYSIAPDSLHIQTTAFRDSNKTDAHKFNEIFKQTFREMRFLLEGFQIAKL